MAKQVRVIDLSLEIGEAPGVLGAQIKYLNHRDSVPEMLASWPGIKPEDLPEGMGWSSETLTLNTHSGTHMDAPYHYHPTMAGKPSRTIDEMPLEWAYGPGVVLDMRHKPAGTNITTDDLQMALKKINYQLKPFDIVLIMTGANKYWKHDLKKYVSEYLGVGREATLWLIQQGIKLVGTGRLPYRQQNSAKPEITNYYGKVILPASRVNITRWKN